MLEPLADLERHAAEQADAVAVATPRRNYTFGQLEAAVRAVSARLDTAGVTSGHLVGVDLPAALEWIVDLALMRLGACAVSLRGVAEPHALGLHALITEPGRRSTPSPLVVEVDELWVDGAVARDPDAPAPASWNDDAIVRVILTSGTTGGTPRAAAYSVGALRYRTAEQHVHWTDGRPELTLIGLSTTGGFHAAVACLRHGIAYLALDRIDAETMRFAASQHIRVLCGSPTQVANALHALVAANIGLPALEEVRLAGATPGAGLLRLIADTLGVPVRGVYGSTEGGGISQHWYELDGDRHTVGVPLPGVELEVVDQEWMPVPVGTEGLIRYRTPGLVSGYLVNGRLVPFVGGWFVPGDLGTLAPDGGLTLGGRESELLNIGGVKLDPTSIDDVALAFPGVEDAAAFGMEQVTGLPGVALAVVARASCDLAALDVELRARLPRAHPTALWRVSEIPRTRLGKVMRAKLSEEFERLKL